MGGLSRLALDQEDIVFTNTICLDAYMSMTEKERWERQRKRHTHSQRQWDR